MNDQELNDKLGKTLLQLAMLEEEMITIKDRMKSIQDENDSMKTLLDEINERTRQFKKTSYDIMIEAPWSPDESISQTV
jgi:hemerythrin superfamily protein